MTGTALCLPGVMVEAGRRPAATPLSCAFALRDVLIRVEEKEKLLSRSWIVAFSMYS